MRADLLAGVAALADPATFPQQIADGFEAAAGEDDLRDLFREVLEQVGH